MKFLLIFFYFVLFGNLVVGQEIKTAGTVRGTLREKLDAHLSQLVEKGFSGAVLVAKNDKILLSKAYGYANRAQKTPVTITTAIPIGSVTKQFTAAAVVKLEMQGTLKFDDFITKYFKDVPPDKSKITIHQLLTHTSGIPSGVGRCRADTTQDDFVRMSINSTLEFEPGTKYSYSNAGYNLLAVIVERASGQGFEQYLHNNLFKPAGMNETGIFIPRYPLEKIAIGYRNGEEWGNVFDRFYGFTELPAKQTNGFWFCGRGSGQMLSTIGDLYKWHRTLEGERVLSKTAKQKMFTSHIREGENATSFYGYGWAIFNTSRKTKLVAHNGNINDVFEADFRRYVDENVVIIMMTNSLNLEQSAIKVTPQIAKIIFDYKNDLRK